MILKLLGLLLISSVGAMLGISASLKLKFRVQLLEKYITLMKETKTKIRISACDIRELFKSNMDFAPLDKMTSDFTRYIKNGKSVKNAWIDAVDNIYKNHSITKTDRDLLSEFGTEFGQNDVDGEINHIDMHISLVEDRLTQARSEFSQKGKLYRTLGLFAGITVSLMIL